MLRFRLEPLYIPSLARHFLPLPKLGASQLALLSTHLEAKGFSVRKGGEPFRCIATKSSQRIAIDGRLGLASSSDDILDALGPAVPELLRSRREDIGPKADITGLYLSLRRSRASVTLQVFPRLESLRTWSCLRRDGLCGLTPDEAFALQWALGSAKSASRVGCVTARPSEGSSPLRVGSKVYFRSELPVHDFLSSLRIINSEAGASCYLPRECVIHVRGGGTGVRLSTEGLGEWCCIS